MSEAQSPRIPAGSGAASEPASSRAMSQAGSERLGALEELGYLLARLPGADDRGAADSLHGDQAGHPA